MNVVKALKEFKIIQEKQLISPKRMPTEQRIF